MAYPAFFDHAPRITLYDPLAHLLGATDDGVLDYSYTDAVRLAGHSCPTVAGAYLMTVKALQALYPHSLPQRGDIVVEFPDSAQDGVTGVIANVVTLITGATVDTGFKGLGGQFDRRDLMYFDADCAGEISFMRRDTGLRVAASYSARNIASSPKTMPLLQRIMSNQATDEQRREFADVWQDRVRRIMEAADEPGLISLQVIEPSHANAN